MDYFHELFQNSPDKKYTLDISDDVLKYIISLIYEIPTQFSKKILLEAVPKLHEFMMLNTNTINKLLGLSLDLCELAELYPILNDSEMYIQKLRSFNYDELESVKLDDCIKSLYICESNIESVIDKITEIL